MKNKKGFTLIELVVVMAIIAILAVMIIGAITVARRLSRESVHRGNARTIQVALESYYAKNKAYPALNGTSTFANEATVIANAIGGTVELTATSECAAGSTYDGGGNIEYSGGGYTLNIADYDCNAELEEIKSQ